MTSHMELSLNMGNMSVEEDTLLARTPAMMAMMELPYAAELNEERKVLSILPSEWARMSQASKTLNSKEEVTPLNKRPNMRKEKLLESSREKNGKSVHEYTHSAGTHLY
jgi:hypothetical protein